MFRFLSKSFVLFADFFSMFLKGVGVLFSFLCALLSNVVVLSSVTNSEKN